MDSRAFAVLLGRMTDAVCRGDGVAAAACFTPEGAYHDGFYGEFAGREAIARMVSEHFHGNARDFVWTIDDACADGGLGYAHYRFSYTASLAGAEGRRVFFEGIARCRLRDGLIARYDEAFDRGVALAQLGFAPERIARSLTKAAGAQRRRAGSEHRLDR
ncbi:MAG: nuclear transport factor 2 family protein [Burkholderiales bacterium]|nr:nuclear transport factor 2 family protein [Burkholderiales bacterium]